MTKKCEENCQNCDNNCEKNGPLPISTLLLTITKILVPTKRFVTIVTFEDFGDGYHTAMAFLREIGVDNPGHFPTNIYKRN